MKKTDKKRAAIIHNGRASGKVASDEAGATRAFPNPVNDAAQVNERPGPSRLDARNPHSPSPLYRALKAGGIGTWVYDLTSGMSVWDDVMLDLFGLDVAPGTATEAVKLIHPADRAEVKKAARALLSPDGPTSFALECRLVRLRGGSPVWVELVAEVVFDGGERTSVSGIIRDITNEKARQTDLETLNATLAESQARLRQATRVGHIGTWIYDLTAHKGVWDEVMLDITGFPASPSSREQSMSAVHPGDIERVEQANSRLAYPDGPTSSHIIHRHIRPDDGRVIWIEVHSEIVFDCIKRTAVVGTVRDITAEITRQQEMEAMNARVTESEADLVRAAKAGGIGIWRLNFATQISVWDEVSRKIAGLNTLTPSLAEEVEAVHPEDRDKLRDIMLAAEAPDGPTSLSLDYRYIHPGTDRTVWVSISADVVFEGDVRIGAVGTLRDITEEHERRRELISLNAQLLESEERRELAMEAGNIGIWQFNAQSKTSDWDATTSYIFGLGDDPQTVAYSTFEDIINAEDLPRLGGLIVEILGRDTAADLNITYRANRVFDGAERRIEAKGRSIMRDGRPTGIIGTVRDITAEYEAAEEIKLMNRELHHRVKNMFATILGMIRMSAREYPGSGDYVKSLSSRVDALSVAHLISMDRDNLAPVNLRQITQAIMAPYLVDGENRIHITGDDFSIPRRAVSNVGMILHELATNAVKYGALSPRGKRLDITLDRDSEAPDERVSITWAETCDPSPDMATGDRKGFGSKLIQSSARQLGSTYEPNWFDTGMNVILTVPSYEQGGQ